MHIFQKSTGWAKFGKQCYCDLKKKLKKVKFFIFEKPYLKNWTWGKKKTNWWANN